MSLILITGGPGAGKTALLVDWLAFSDQFKNRPIFQMGIPELQLEHQPVPPVADWTEMRASPEDPSLFLPYFTFPPNAVVVIDEAQRVYRPRSVGSKVPPEVAAFETHRHTGIDVILLTQHANFLDANIRKLIGRHVHVHVQPFGRELLDWTRLGDVDSKADRELSSRSKYKPPSRVFSLYKSAEVHTKIKRPIPKVFYLLVAAVVGVVVLGTYVAQRVKGRVDPPPPVVQKTVTRDENRPGLSSSLSSAAPAKSLGEYMADREPRIVGLLHTAPMYDGLTAPTEAPYPVGCVQFGQRCKCVDQQGANYPAGLELCRSFVADGMFIPFRARRDVGVPAAPSSSGVVPGSDRG